MPTTTTKTIKKNRSRKNSSSEKPARGASRGPAQIGSAELYKRSTSRRPVAVFSMGCPRGVGPEICLQASLHKSAPSSVIVGKRAILEMAARALGYPKKRIDRIPAWSTVRHQEWQGPALLDVGPELSTDERLWGHPEEDAGVAQLVYIEEAYALAKQNGWPLVTAPVSKEAIAKCGLPRARTFLGHTEWLEKLDHAPHSVMCFSSPRLTCSLVTTHVPLRALARLVSPSLVAKAICELGDLLLRRGTRRPSLAVCSLNPHGGEGQLLGKEEGAAIAPGIRIAQEVLGKKAIVSGPVGAETAFRKAVAGGYDGVVAIYHDQATIPMKLIDFGGAVNVTQGLSIVRTSVDHGTAYDIAGRGIADVRGLQCAWELGVLLGKTKRRVLHGSW